ncbi:hypothetical protein DFQ27_008916 [Actinomortierella ambigua]|uniref:Protein kinase domain-containing protein n=1 Tax=Actinomortierella ambigua TaxID=1343610 RepID=A0A9P6TY58_9FUNG|nr:hypothetical protein DFQ27_008916 [Actinomortierella ambigua]
MDLAENGTLADAIGKNKLTDWPMRRRIGHEIARGLEYIHSCKIIHRDLKPENVLLTLHWQVKLCDFGLARTHSMNLSTTGDFKGTARWSAPEIFRSPPQYTTKSDVYSLGMILWAMAANRKQPFGEELNFFELMDLIKTGTQEEMPEGVPVEFRECTEKCWDPDYNKRPEASDVILLMGQELTEAKSREEEEDAKAQFLSFSFSQNFQALNLADDEPGETDGAPPPNGQEHIPPHEEEELSRLLRLADDGNTAAQVELGRIYEEGTMVEQSFDKAFEWYRKAAEGESVEGQHRLGTMYQYGRGVQQDLVAAVSWYRRAAKQDYRESQTSFGAMYFDERCDCSDLTLEEVALWLGKAAEQGDPEAHVYLGTIYERQQNQDEAMAWFLKAADLGHARAQYLLGRHYQGAGNHQDHAVAIDWYQKAASQDYVEAQTTLGVTYFNGHGVPRDNTEAAFWLRKAATRGDVRAAAYLQSMHAQGQGVDQRDVSSTATYRKASERGNA